MKKKPSDYVKDCPVYVTCEPEETSLAYVTQVIGDDRSCFPPTIRTSESMANF